MIFIVQGLGDEMMRYAFGISHCVVKKISRSRVKGPARKLADSFLGGQRCC